MDVGEGVVGHSVEVHAGREVGGSSSGWIVMHRVLQGVHVAGVAVGASCSSLGLEERLGLDLAVGEPDEPAGGWRSGPGGSAHEVGGGGFVVAGLLVHGGVVAGIDLAGGALAQLHERSGVRGDELVRVGVDAEVAQLLLDA